ncbi:MAG: hypothetical protein MZW92_39695 [Comamonadaceae bacterium]|nr:hypothetical protein [Comamonadaceae bacterium]
MRADRPVIVARAALRRRSTSAALRGQRAGARRARIYASADATRCSTAGCSTAGSRFGASLLMPRAGIDLRAA